MEAAGAARIAFNPLTPAFVAKALARVAEAEGLPLAPDAAKVLAERCAGDLRAALDALQLAAAGAPAPPPSKKVAPAGCLLYLCGRSSGAVHAGAGALRPLMKRADACSEFGLCSYVSCALVARMSF